MKIKTAIGTSLLFIGIIGFCSCSEQKAEIPKPKIDQASEMARQFPGSTVMGKKLLSSTLEMRREFIRSNSVVILDSILLDLDNDGIVSRAIFRDVFATASLEITPDQEAQLLKRWPSSDWIVAAMLTNVTISHGEESIPVRTWFGKCLKISERKRDVH